MEAEKRLSKAFLPPPDLTVSEWADQERVLSSESSAEPGRWQTSRTEYLRGIMDTFSAPEIHTVVVMSASQIGKTECLNCIIGYFMHYDPSPILVMQPTLEMAENWSKERLAPMLRDTPALKSLVKDPRSRDSGNTLLHKKFPGGSVSATGSNSPASLASRPIRVVLADEVDRYGASAGTEGDPVDLARKRTATFHNRKILLTSTPTIKELSRIEMAFLESDQRYYQVPCGECGKYQRLEWKHVKWEHGQPETAHYECCHCGEPWDESMRISAISKGKWIATKETRGIAGFHLHGLYSPWIPIAKAVDEFLKAKASPDTLKVFVNTYFGETWEDEGEQVDNTGLFNRREKYEAEVPDGVLVLTAGVDVQDDRLEFGVIGTGLEEETWQIDYKIIHGDPSTPQVWLDLLLAIKTIYKNKEGKGFRIQATCIDSGGHFTQTVYGFCKQNMRHRVFAIKGKGGEGVPIIGRPSRNNIGKIKLFPVGVDTTKSLIYRRLRILQPGPGYIHFPMGHDQEYFKQLTAEKIIITKHKGYPKKSFVKVRPRNEALDVMVYSMAAFHLLNIKKLEDLKAQMADTGTPKSRGRRLISQGINL